MTASIAFDLGDGRTVGVALDGDEVVLSIDGAERLRLSREEGWQLAEAIDAIATASDLG